MTRYGISLLAILFSTHAFAQSTPGDAAATGDGDVIKDIIVTAQKGARAESVQKVPLAITAVTAETIRDQQFTSITDVGRIAPTVQLAGASSFPAFANFYIRGIGLNGTVRTIDPAVQVITDGMVNEFLVGTLLDTFDVASVEVLRGPQGILQGRNATGGAVSFTSRRPTDRYELEASVRYGTGDRLDFSLLAAGPVIKDKLYAKLAVLRRKSDGLFHDRNKGVFVPSLANPGGTDTSAQYDSGAEDIWAFRPTLVFKPTERLEISLIGEYVDQGGGSGVGARFLNNATNSQSIFGYTPDFAKGNMNSNRKGLLDLKQTRIVGEIKWETSIGVLTSVSGFRDVDYKTNYDAAGFPFILFTFPEGNRDQSKQYSEEIRFASDFSDTFKFVVGGYYSDLSIETLELRLLSGFFGGGSANLIRSQRGRFKQDSTSKALFYNLEWTPIDGLTLSHGGRYTKDEKDIEIVPLSLCTGSNFTACPDTSTFRSAAFNDFSPKFSAQYQIAPRVLAYASWTRGYRSGNFNARATSVAAIGPAQPENVRSIEAGLKSTFWGGRGRVNLAAYTSDYQDIQRTVTIGPTQTLANAATATIKGFELETTFVPLPGFELVGNVGYVDAHFKEFLNLDVNGGGYDPNVDPDLARKLKFERVPKWTGYVSASYTQELPDDMRLISRVNFSYQSSIFFDALNEIRQAPVGLVGVNVTLEKGQWRLSAYGRNLTNRDFADQGSRFNVGPGASGVAYHVWGGEPRNYGVELAFKL
jgi:iron complex outermembrane receptor protein